MRKITTKELMSKVFIGTNGEWSSKSPCIIEFSANWCKPCKSQEVVLNELSKEIEGVDFYKVDVEEEYELAEIFNIRNLPTIIICGKDTERFSGFIHKQKLNTVIKNHI